MQSGTRSVWQRCRQLCVGSIKSAKSMNAKWCPCCGKKNSISFADRTYACSCGYQEDGDVHSAKNMLVIKNLVFSKLSVPPEQREVTLMEFKTATGCSAAAAGKPGR